VDLGGTIIEGTVQGYLARANHRFHLVFMDPPWPDPTDLMEADMVAIDRLLLPDAEVVVSRRNTDRIPVGPENWRVATDKR
jgi:16S rRNA G966 N2-methylase RsmD